MDDTTNADRANWALAALSGFVVSTGVDTAKSAIADLITNLLHLGRGRGFDTTELVERAHGMMAEEVSEDFEGNMTRVQRAFSALLADDGF